jgi:hypothetical protein
MTLGLLVGRFGHYVRENYVPPVQMEPASEFPDSLNHLREATGHHLIPLVLIAHADGDFAPSERDVIVAHCTSFARSRGISINGQDTRVFAEYIEDYRPTLVQLDPALMRLSHATHDEIVALIEAARAVVNADGITRPEEARLLDEMSEELARLKPAS